MGKAIVYKAEELKPLEQLEAATACDSEDLDDDAVYDWESLTLDGTDDDDRESSFVQSTDIQQASKASGASLWSYALGITGAVVVSTIIGFFMSLYCISRSVRFEFCLMTRMIFQSSDGARNRTIKIEPNFICV